MHQTENHAIDGQQGGARMSAMLPRDLAGPLRFLLLVVCMGFCATSMAESSLVTSQEAFESAVKKAGPGDTIRLANGVWRDFEMLFVGEGEPDKPITLTAETKGEVIISGRSNLRLAGRHLVVSGLVFRDGYTPTNTVIAFRQSKTKNAHHSRVTEVVIDHFNNPERHETDFWVMMYGKHNRFDHNHLEGKSNKGVTMAVRLDTEDSRANHHRIDHNYFGPRPILGSNGGETLRIGTSHYSLSDSFTVVENNYFDRCDGELEIISNKSGRNVFRGNVFFEARGTLTMRHGNDTLVENNVFFGNGVPHTGGIRVINKRQTVRNNYLQGLTGNRFGAALTIMNGVPNSPINRYHQVEDSVVENNTIIDSVNVELAAGSDAERSAIPQSTTFGNNLIYNKEAQTSINIHDDISGISFSGNLTNSAAVGEKLPDTEVTRIKLKRAANGLLYPTGKKAQRGSGVSRDLKVTGIDQTGVKWYPKPEKNSPFRSGRKHRVDPARGALGKVVAKADAGDIIVLAPGNHTVSRTLEIDRPLTIRSASKRRPAKIQFERSSLFQVGSGAGLELLDLEISGKVAPDMAGNSVVRTSQAPSPGNYDLVIRNVTVKGLTTNHTFNFITAARHTFADRIVISDSRFSDITGSILALNAETDDLGIYNGEYVTVEDSEFTDIAGAVVDIYRGGTDESTFGPQLVFRNSTLERVGQGKRNRSGASINLVGAQRVQVEGNTFRDSAPIRFVETTGEPKTSWRGNTFKNTPDEIRGE